MRCAKFLSFVGHIFSPYTLNEGEKLPPKAIIVGAPHTSYWDAVLMAIGLWKVGRHFNFFVKDSAVNSPFGPIIKAVGGLAVDRSRSHGLVDYAVARARENSDFLLVITPKGTRGKREFWKSGFYHIAMQADLPVVLGYITRTPRKTYGWGKTIRLSGDMRADMEKIRAFYADKTGIRPELRSEPRLRGEDGTADAPNSPARKD
ncbi:1-acyl-sn-glycerol-3-phosphate acyltransferase [Arcanobacterium sp. S3PF19]|uniref:1-acyl-sn-glycerol-3-phosphate acyltransferase n=1 Tax=Arcanobacterium sp. S3PF19 TaxID=1219585 RepID=UPI00050E5AF1|nr:1-acyl-sn-glycerol-3-phosphate acyltransferase [Arcanobacterium sp. S3PF19]KGF05677.1 acyltransferase [Arcanobacterium sp. S3PF19]